MVEQRRSFTTLAMLRIGMTFLIKMKGSHQEKPVLREAPGYSSKSYVGPTQTYRVRGHQAFKVKCHRG